MFDKKAFRSASYGLYIVTASDGQEKAGCVVNTFVQLTSTPARASVAINKENHSCCVVERAGRFNVTVLDEDAPMELIGVFGFKSGRDIDKFAQVGWKADGAGVPYVTDHAQARFSFRLIETVDVGTHLLFIGEADEAEALSDAQPMTYAYYHQVKGGKTPPKASSFSDLALAADAAKSEPAAKSGEASQVSVASGSPESEGGHHDEGEKIEPVIVNGKRVGWVCTVCGYIEWTEELPEGFECPICGLGPDVFERVEE